jgi:hypothetical protein
MIQKRKQKENPSPLAPKICVCGCENEFQPNRSDQIYLNSKHSDYAYNKGKRKERYESEKLISKAIRLNDRIAEKFFKCSESLRPRINLVLLKMEGFDVDVFTRVVQKEVLGQRFQLLHLYNFGFRIFTQDKSTIIEIHKL